MIRNMKNTGKSDLKQSFGGLIEIIHTTCTLYIKHETLTLINNN